MNKLLTALLAIALLPTPALAQETAEDLVASMRIADMTYKELMTIMGRSISLMHSRAARRRSRTPGARCRTSSAASASLRASTAGSTATKLRPPMGTRSHSDGVSGWRATRAA